jgi:hypothetical protein
MRARSASRASPFAPDTERLFFVAAEMEGQTRNARMHCGPDPDLPLSTGRSAPPPGATKKQGSRSCLVSLIRPAQGEPDAD